MNNNNNTAPTWTALTELATLKLELIDARATTKRMNKASYETIERMTNQTRDAIDNLRDENAKLDRMLNNSLDAHAITKQRLLRYENEVGVPNNKGINDHRLGGGDEFYKLASKIK